MIRDVTKILYSLLLDFETRSMAKLNIKTQKKADEISARFGKEVTVLFIIFYLLTIIVHLEKKKKERALIRIKLLPKVPTLTDGKEWLSARTSVKLYGKELVLSELTPGTDFHQFNPPNFKDLQRVQPKDEFSHLQVYEKALSRMKNAIVSSPEDYPTKILLTGTGFLF